MTGWKNWFGRNDFGRLSPEERLARADVAMSQS